MAAHSPSLLWPKSLLAERSMADFTSPRPYEVFKLVHSYFVRSARVPDHDSFLEAGKLRTSPLRPKRTSSRFFFKERQRPLLLTASSPPR